MIEKRIKSAIPIYLAGIAFTVSCFIFPPYKAYYLAICSVISVFIYFISEKLMPSRTILVEAPLKQADTGNGAVDEIITRGREQLREISELGKRIQSGEVAAQIEDIGTCGLKIFDFIEGHPEKARDIRQFMDYYLPTTLKLVNNYVKFKSQGTGGENIKRAVGKIEGIMGNICDAYKKQYDNLFEDNSMDIVAEVNVMEKLLKAEGLTDDIREAAERTRG